MSTRKAIKGDEAMVSALYEWMDEIEQDHGCPVRVVLHKSRLKGRLDIRVEGCETADGRLVGVRGQQKLQHPSGNATDLGAALLGALVKLHGTLEELKTFMQTPDEGGA